MAHPKKQKSSSKGSNKTFAAKRTINPPAVGSHQGNTGSPKASQQQDPARRLGDFERKGDHARGGSRGHQ